MRFLGSELELSATDLSNFLSCRHRTALDMAAAFGKRLRPRWEDPLREILFQRGIEHEKAYVESLRSAGREVVDLGDLRDRGVVLARTLELMRGGADVIVQAALGDGRWYGRPDVMRRVDRASERRGRGRFSSWGFTPRCWGSRRG